MVDKSLKVLISSLFMGIAIAIISSNLATLISTSKLFLIQWLPIISGVLASSLSFTIVNIVGEEDVYGKNPELAFWGIPLLSGAISFAIYHLPVPIVGMASSQLFGIGDFFSDVSTSLQMFVYLVFAMILGMGVLSLKVFGLSAIAGVVGCVIGGAFLADVSDIDFLAQSGSNGYGVDMVSVLLVVIVILVVMVIAYIVERREKYG